MTALPVSRQLARAGFETLPAIVASRGEKASWRFVEFFTANIRNPNTRRAYARAVGDFLHWCEQRNLGALEQIRPFTVSAWVEERTRTHAAPSVKQQLAAIRMLFDWLVVGQIMDSNPASSVRGPKYVVKKGKTPVLTAEEARELLDSIDTSTIIGLRDRALIATMVYSFARIGAVLKMDVQDHFSQGKRWWLRLHEKGGRRHDVPCHHTLDEYLDAYLDVTGIRNLPKGPLFRTAARSPGRPLSENRMEQSEAWRMIRRRAKDAGIKTLIGNHTFRATGITAYLQNGGTLEHAQQIAAHESPRTTKLYDRRADQVNLDEIERIAI